MVCLTKRMSLFWSIKRVDPMAVKVLMTWDIAGERDQDYFEFIIGEFIPGVQRLGLATR